MKNIYLLKIIEGCVAYDSYDAHVIVANSEEDARAVAPIADEGGIWKDPKLVSCLFIGEFNCATPPDMVLDLPVLLSSFNAG